jgi:hypothetical protein
MPGSCKFSGRSESIIASETGGRLRQLLTLLAPPDWPAGEDIYDSLLPDNVADPEGERTSVKARTSRAAQAPRRRGDTVAGCIRLPLSAWTALKQSVPVA